MSAENKSLVTAADNKIAPQYYNPAADAYEHLRGKNGGSNVNVIETVLPAGAATAAKQDEQTGHLEALVAKDFATDAKLDLILSKLGDIESEIEAIKSTDGIKRIDEAVDVQLTGRIVKITTISDVTIPAGTTADVIANLDLSHGKTKEWYFTFYAGGVANSNVTATLEFSRQSGVWSTSRRCWSEDMTISNGGLITDVPDSRWGLHAKPKIGHIVVGSYMRFRITNNHTANDLVFRSGQLVEIQPLGG